MWFAHLAYYLMDYIKKYYKKSQVGHILNALAQDNALKVLQTMVYFAF
jgi:hypothetical protein